jgi:hypothetical protein
LFASLAPALTLAMHALAHASGPAPADLVYRNGIVYTVDGGDSVQQALAVRAGRIVHVGDDAGASALTGKTTRVVDLQGRMLMPGLVDAHMHPQSGGSRLLNCSLDYAPLSVPAFQARIQACLDRDTKSAPGRWLVVVNWFQQGMQPEGAATAALLDVLKTTRPIIVRSSFGHSALLNTRGLALAGVKSETPDPPAGKIVRDAAGAATGLLEDAAQDLAMRLLPPLSPREQLAASRAALDAMRRQGITSFLDAWTDPETMTAFAALQRRGRLTARAHFAVLIDLEKGATARGAVAALLKEQKRFDQGPTGIRPSMQVRHAKLFMDGVIAAPAFTGAMLTPYLVNRGTSERPDWQPGPDKGPPSYFSASALGATLTALARAGIDPHIHADGDRAVRDSLDAIERVRATPAGRRLRPALAHAEIVDPADYPRFAGLDVTPVLSFQWAKPAPDTVGALRDYLGPARYAAVEPQALLLDAGARIAYGSDWPVDPLDISFALKVGVTRTAAPGAGKEFGGRLTAQPGMPRAAVLRAVTLNAAYTLRQETRLGSLEVGKLADLVVLDRNPLTVAEEDLASIQVLQTVVGGKVVYEAEAMRRRAGP